MEGIDQFFKMDFPLIVAQIIVAVILVIFFTAFLYNPFSKWLDKRSKYLLNIKDKTEENLKQADFLKRKQEKEISISKEKIKKFEEKSILEINEKLKKEILKSENFRKEIIQNAKIDANKIIKDSYDKSKESIVKNSILLSKKILEEEMNETKHKKMIDDFIKELDSSI